jgi:pimeloyl-ACP methyl ester carboxylesterase
MSNGIKQQQIVLKDLLVTYYTAGESSSKPLIFLHGWRSNSALWFGIFPKLLEAGYSIFALDFPGFGKSQMPKAAFFLQNYVDIVAEFMQKLDINKATVIGHSHGGRVSIKMAAQTPEKIENLVLVDSGGIKKETAEKNVKKGLAKMLKPFFAPSFMKPVKNKIYTMMGADDYVATPELQQTFLNVINEDLLPLLSKIKNNTLLLWGENDMDTPVGDGEVMKKNIPHSDLVVLKNAGHYSFLDQPEEFTKYLLEFLGK